MKVGELMQLLKSLDEDADIYMRNYTSEDIDMMQDYMQLPAVYTDSNGKKWVRVDGLRISEME